MTRGIRAKTRGRSGQAVIEYILMALVVLSVVSALSFGLRSVVSKIWMQMACNITAPCPHCQPLPDVKTAANKIASGSCQ